MSPLRYQKWLRLNEARRLMLNEHYDVTTAAYVVGYESLSHFSREYILPFQARYIALGQSVAGTANADATFKVQYL